MKLKKFLSLFMSFLILFSMMSTLFINASAAQVKMYTVHVEGIKRSKANLKGPWAISYSSSDHSMHYRSDSIDKNGDAPITYCIEPGTTLANGDYSDSVSTTEYWKAYDKGNFNTVLKSDQVREFISRLYKYGYNGTVNDGNWEGKNLTELSETAQKKVLKALATQILIWEVIVGERDANFNHIEPSSSAKWKTVKSVHTVSTDKSKTTGKTLRQLYNDYYDAIVDKMKAFPKVPSFANGSSNKIARLEKSSNSYFYRMTFTDSNKVLNNFKVSYTDNNNTNYVQKIEQSGNKLEVYIKYGAPNDYKVNIKLEKKENDTTDIKRPKLYIWGDTVVGNDGIQNIVGTNGTVGDKISASVSAVLNLGSIKVTKTSTDGKKKGFSFSISSKNVDTIAKTTDNNGIATFTGLPASSLAGNYTVKENLSANSHYLLTSNKTVTVSSGAQSSVSFNNVNKKIRFQAVKVDSSTTSAQGDATLEGATYDLYRGTTKIATYVTDANGKFKAGGAQNEVSLNSFTGAKNEAGYTAYYFATDTNGNFYNYSLKEVSASKGYTVNSKSVALTVSGAVTASSGEYSTAPKVNLPETVIKDNIRIYKHSDKDSSTNTPEAGAVFRIWLTSNGSYDKSPANERDEFTTGNNGFGYSKSLPYGNYTVEQTKGKENAYLANSFKVFIDGTTSSQNTYRNIRINNIPKTAMIRVNKLDSSTGNRITRSSASFNLYDEKGNKINADPVLTDNTGTLMFDYSLDFGTYYLEEVQAPNGYVPQTGRIKVTVNDSIVEKINNQYIVTVNVRNKPQKAYIQIYKIGSSFISVEHDEASGTYKPVYSTSGLKNAKFNVYADEDIYRGDGTSVYNKGQLVTTLVTDETGMAKSEDALPLGEYYLKEVEAPEGYILLPDKIPVSLNYNASLGDTYVIDTITITNSKYNSRFSLIKEMEVNDTFNIGNNKEYESVEFGLYAAEKIVAQDETYIPADGLLETAKVDKNGNVLFDTITHNGGLPLGFYYVKEISTHPSYELDGTKYYFELNEEMFNEAENGIVTVKINEGKPIKNNLKYGAVSGIKVDEDDNPLEGALMGLFKGIATEDTVFVEENAIATVLTDEYGYFSFGNEIPYGEYTVYEIDPPFVDENRDKKYNRIDSQRLGISFTINDENQNITESLLKFINEKPDNPVKIVINKTSENGRVEGFLFKIEKISTDGTITTIGNFVTNAMGIIEVDGLDLKYTYRVTEVENDKTVGFIIPDAQEQFAVRESLLMENGYHIMKFDFENKLKKGTIVLNKTAEDGTLDGFEFYINGTTLTGENYSKTDYTNANGIITFEDIPFGTYTISEEVNDKSMKFVIPEKQVVILSDDTPNATANVTFENVYPKGSLLITKSSPDDGKIENVEFLIKGLDTEYEKTYKTDAEGKIKIDNLRVGVYEVSEVERLNTDGKNPYVTVNSKTVVVDKDKETVVEPFINKLKKGTVSIKKTSENNVVEGFTFNLKGTTLDGESYNKDFVTDEQGYICENRGDTSIKLVAGTYTVSEIENEKTIGYAIPDAVTFSIEDDGIVVPMIVMHNSLAKGQLKIVKTSDNGVVEGFTFKVEGKTLLGEDYEMTTVTDVNGLATIEDVPLGTYTVTEVQNDNTNGYVIESPKSVVIGTDGETKEVPFNNILKKGTLTISKTSEDNIVEDIGFDIKGTTVLGEDYEQILYTNAEGKISITIPAGEYVVSEIANSTTEQYIVPVDQNVTIEHGDEKEVSFHNVLKKGTLKIVKEAEDGNVSNIPFNIEGLTLSGTEYSQTLKTNKKGIIEVVIPYGDYKITEGDAEGYVENYPKEISIDSETEQVNFYNWLKKGILKIKKTSTDGVVEGFSFKIEGTTDAGSSYSNILLTDEDGLIVAKIPTGEYTVSEVKNKKSKGYILPDDQVTTIYEDGVSTLKFENVKKPKDVKHSDPKPIKKKSPQTGDISDIEGTPIRIWLLLLATIVSGGLCIISKRKIKGSDK